MSPEAINPGTDDLADSGPPMSEYLAKIEAQKERMGSAAVLRDKINDLLGLIGLADYTDKYAREASRRMEDADSQEAWSNIAQTMGEEVMAATHDLERYMLQCRRYDKHFVFKVGNLPRDSFVIAVDSHRLVDEEGEGVKEVAEFVADDLDVRGRQGINLINRKQGTRVMLSATQSITVAAVFDDKTEEE